MTTDKWMWAKRVRERWWGRCGGPLPPVPRGPRWFIECGTTTWMPDWQVSEALERIDSRLVLLYDPLTRQYPWHPKELAVHLYRRIPGQAILVLEASLQWDMSAEWPKGDPRSPGLWLITWVKSHLKTQFSGDERHIDDGLIRQDVSVKERSEIVRKAKDDEQIWASAGEMAFEMNRILS